MIIRNDLKNTDYYKRAMEVYKQNTWDEINKQLYLTIYFMIIGGIFLYGQMNSGGNPQDMTSDIIALIVCCFIYIGNKFWKLTWKYEIYQITVVRKWRSGNSGSKYYWISESTDKTDRKSLYRIDEPYLYNTIVEGNTYIFFAKDNVLYEVLSMTKR